MTRPGSKRPSKKIARNLLQRGLESVVAFQDLLKERLGNVTKDEIRARIRSSFFRSVPDREGLECSISDRSSGKSKGTVTQDVWRLKCISCTTCRRAQTSGWHGRASFADGMLHIRGLKPTAHGSFDWRRSSNALRDEHKARLHSMLACLRESSPMWKSGHRSETMKALRICDGSVKLRRHCRKRLSRFCFCCPREQYFSVAYPISLGHDTQVHVFAERQYMYLKTM